MYTTHRGMIFMLKSEIRQTGNRNNVNTVCLFEQCSINKGKWQEIFINFVNTETMPQLLKNKPPIM